MRRQDGGYNRVYEHLVDSDDDVIGLVAYALYKQDKRDWLIDWHQTRGAGPSDEEMEVYNSTQMTPGQRSRFRVVAGDVLNAHALVTVEAERPLIVQDAITQRIETAARSIEDASTWWKQIPAGIVAAIAYTILLIGIAVVLRFAGIDLLSIVGSINQN